MCTFAFVMKKQPLRYVPCVATIGFFDGVHRGHLYLIQQVTRLAEERGLVSRLVTFDRHPRVVLQLDYVPALLTTLEEKLTLLKGTGADDISLLPFTRELSRLTAKDFMRKVLYEELGARVLVLGYDHRFGHGGGTWEEYRKWGEETGIEVVRAQALDGEHVSSSRCRTLLMDGDVCGVAGLLGRRYVMSGEVVRGFQVGHELGFPTANLEIDREKVMPARGAYAVWVRMADGTCHEGMLNIGNRPTIGNGEAASIEVNLLDYKGDLYGQQLSVEFVDRLREERRFASKDELMAQLAQDEATTRSILQAP